jgi:hypothetical protein
MKAAARCIVALAAGGLLVLCGCKDKVEEISSCDYLLGRQHGNWRAARETIATDSPDLERVRTAGILLRRVHDRIDTDYSGPDKEQVKAKVEQLAELFDGEIASRLNMRSPRAALAPGATIQDLRAGFEKVDKEYRVLEEMTARK